MVTHPCFATAISSVALLAIDGAITNPHGFGDRILYLLGPASQDQRKLPARLGRPVPAAGRRHRQLSTRLSQAAAYLGIRPLVHVWRWRGETSALGSAGFLPLFAMVSFTLTFNLIALRPTDRFLLAQTIFFSVYLGMAVDALAFAAYPAIRWVARVAVLALAGVCFLPMCRS